MLYFCLVSNSMFLESLSDSDDMLSLFLRSIFPTLDFSDHVFEGKNLSRKYLRIHDLISLGKGGESFSKMAFILLIIEPRERQPNVIRRLHSQIGDLYKAL